MCLRLVTGLCHGGVAGRIVPGSGATSLGAALSGALKSTCTGSSSEGAIVYAEARVCVWWLHGCGWEKRKGSLLINGHHRAEMA
jgi:hypothetical protein